MSHACWKEFQSDEQSGENRFSKDISSPSLSEEEVTPGQ
jgi:hypothetical protein